MRKILLLLLLYPTWLLSIAQDTTQHSTKTQSTTVQPNLIQPPPGECELDGTTAVTLGQSYTYTMTCLYPSVTWSATNGTIISSSATSATVQWGLPVLEAENNNESNFADDRMALGGPNAGISFTNRSDIPTLTGTIQAKYNGSIVASATVTILTPPLAGGSLSPSQQTIAYNTVPATLTELGATSGATYQWQSSTDASSWTNILGAHGTTYSPDTLKNNTHYRIAVSQNTQTVYSSTALVTVTLQAGTISPSSKSILYNASPGTLTCSAPKGGSINHTYQWQVSTDKIHWSNISGATALTYIPGNLATTTFYRLQVDGQKYSNTSIIYITGAPINNPPLAGDFTMPSVAVADTVHSGKSDIVGAIAGNASVSLTGAATYTIPIQLPPGTNGLEPSVSVSYSSESGDGVAGWGWSLNASTVITRAGKNTYYNGSTSPINYTNSNDAFILDGQRLMVVSGNNGADGTIYGTENESFAKIQSFGGSETSGPDYFVVTTKDGKIMEFGHTTDSKLNTDNGQSTMMWYLDKVTDQNGNFMKYQYTINSTDRDFALTEIDYTGNTISGLQPYNKVLFTYTVRQYWQDRRKYVSGASLVSPFNLSNISVKDQLGNTVRSYNCGYNLVNNVYYLASVSETGSDGTSLTPTTFTYGDSSNIADMVWSGSTPLINGAVDLTYGDYNGDGRMDVLIDSFKYDNKGFKLHTSLKIFSDITIDGNASSAAVLFERSFTPESYTIIKNTAFSTNNYRFTTSDFTGDGADDIIDINSTLYNPGSNYKPIQTPQSIKLFSIHRFNSGIKIDSVLLSATPTGFLDNRTYSYIPDGKEFFIPGDFDGDGTSDYILMLGQFETIGSPSSGVYYKAFFTSPAKNIVNQEIFNFTIDGNTNINTYAATSIATADQVTPIQLNGGGKTAILVTKGDSSYLLTISPLPGSVGLGSSYVATVITKTATISKNNVFYTADFNGDGNSDLLLRASDGKTNGYAAWSVLYGTGAQSGFPFTAPSSFSFPSLIQLPGDNNRNSAHTISKILIADFDGDGNSEIGVGYYITPSSDANALTGRIAIAKMKGQQYGYNYTYYDAPNLDPYANGLAAGDFNGDGRADFFCPDYTYSFYYSKPFSTSTLLRKVLDGLGVTTTFNYQSLSDGRITSPATFYHQADYSTTDSLTNYPFNVVRSPIFAVSSISVPNGIGGTTTVNYNYKDAIFNRAGKGFLGFKSVISKNLATGITSETDFNISAHYAVPYETKQTTSLTSSGELLSEQDISTSLVSKSTNGYFDMRYFPQINKTINIDYLKGSATEEDNTYDSYGNITTSVSKAGGWSGSAVSAVETTKSTTTFGTHSTPVPALPDKIIAQHSRSGQTVLSEESDFTYDAKGNVATKIEYAGKPLALTTTNVYDNYGNLTQSTLSASGISNRIVHNTYDAQGRFVLKKQQPGSGITKTQSYTYDSWGNPLTTVSTDGLTTTYYYDGFGRNTKMLLPDGQIILNALTWSNTGNVSYINYKYAQDGGQASVKTAYDMLGREIAQQTSGFNGQFLSQTSTYDAKGNIASQKMPYYQNETAEVVTTQYDTYNRVIKVSTPVNYTSTSYSKLSGGQFKVTVTNSAGQASSKTQDGAGRVVNAIDNGGQLNFTYDSRGNQTKVAIGSTVLVTAVYDDYSRQTSLTDKNAGTMTYQYDALGKLTQQKDALNHIYTTSYDDFGRLTSKTGPEGTTSYIYYSDGTKNNDNIVKITGFSGDVTDYTYDNLGRKITQKTTVDGTSYTDQFQYNSFGQLIKTTYASGVIINDEYDANGTPTKTSLQNGSTSTTLFTATAMNSKGIYTGYKYGNGKSSQVTFNLNLGVPTRYYTSGIQDLNMVWDANSSNLTSRKDAIKNLTETFTYDNLKRLTGASVNNVQQFSMTYDNNSGTSLGNIDTKSDAGKYVYNTTKINAVAYITDTGSNQMLPPPNISQNTQTLGYTPFLKVDTIAQNGYVLKYTYGADQQRIKSILLQNGTTVETKYYFGDYEKQIKGDTTRYIHYIGAGNGLCAIVVKEGTVTKVYYVYSDHLGSILTLTDGTGAIVAKQNFDAWGRKRNPDNWTYTNVSNVPTWLYRGYTGHEHLTQFSLINMNGRVYDPVQGRMLSPDNYVANQWGTQAYNRYSYANNNPLSYIDQDGNNPVVVALLIAAAVSAASYTLHVALSPGGFSNWSWTEFAGQLITGAVEGAITYGIGSAFGTTGNLWHELLRAGAHGLDGYAMSAMTGGNGKSGFLSSAVSSLVGSGIDMYAGPNSILSSSAADYAISGLTGGASSSIAGGSFWEGAANGIIVEGFNHLVQQKLENDRRKLKEKILADGKLTLQEANEWYRTGGGGDLTVDADQVDLDFLNPNEWGVGDRKNVQTLYNSVDGLVYGNIFVDYMGSYQFMIEKDRYDFDIKPNPKHQFKVWFRNKATKIGHWYAGKGIPFDIYFRGFDTVLPK
ncbi:hypothetical protein A9P82_12995 [Arachidicoccus ginsenosidimutans]|uniref:SpvB/TcaC N-terminal domain-containing protein n=1 Tax=Arachidicoccus sp. BS20 TaxID=1850526 RepID=UPI0007F06984|nr:SpvB/TcaC N-terminal domain-containing protein [Arachidicoccus sp. BS20]ANI90119.1 hypothetical protein A9P82_12995 [Arachidicoccus sp. BS20]